jgi:hypothetical protein
MLAIGVEINEIIENVSRRSGQREREGRADYL